MPTRKPSPTARPANRPPHEPTKVDRDTVAAMVAAGIAQVDIARCCAVSEPTLRKHYKEEIRTGTTTLNTMVILAHIERIKAGDFQAIKWWQQARMGWSERTLAPCVRCVSSWSSLAKPLRHGSSNPHLDRDRAYQTPHGCSWWGEMARPVNWCRTRFSRIAGGSGNVLPGFLAACNWAAEFIEWGEFNPPEEPALAALAVSLYVPNARSDRHRGPMPRVRTSTGRIPLPWSETP